MAQLSISVEKALARTPERLAALLAPGVEYTGTIYRKVAYCDESGTPRGNRYIRVSGTLPTLAAARNRPELLRFLLDCGHDVNSASQAAVEALLADTTLHSFPFALPQPHPGTLYANMRSSIASGTGKSLSAPLPFEHPAFSLSGVTPLAAAILCGSVGCVRVLLERPGVWTTECPAVSVTLALAWRRADPDYRETCRLARTLPDASLRPLALWSVIEESCADFLRAELAAAPYDTTAVREAAKKLLCFYGTRLNIPPCPPPLAEKLTLLASHDPRAFQEQLLCEYLAALFLAEQGSARMRTLVERFCRGRTIDLSASSSLLRAVSARELASGLDTLRGFCTPAVNCDADICRICAGADGEKLLRILLERVRILPSSFGKGLSALTRAVLSTGSLSLLDLALKKGAIPAREPLTLMMPLVEGAPALRARLLTEERPDTPLPPTDWTHGIQRTFPELYQRRAVFPDASPRSSGAPVKSLIQLRPNGAAVQSVELWFGIVIVLNNMVFMAMLGRAETELLRGALTARPQRYGTGQVRPVADEDRQAFDGWMDLTPMCAAALAGQAETAEMLLSLGYDANERDVGSPSLLHITSSRAHEYAFPVEITFREVPLSPLLCAILSGSKEVEALLRAHGAAWDMETESAREAMELLGRS